MMYGDIVIILVVILVIAAIVGPPIYSKLTGKKVKGPCGCNCGCDCCESKEFEDKKEE